MSATTSVSSAVADEAAQYREFERLMSDRIASISEPMFTTTVDEETLWETYISNIPAVSRQTYVCSCCRHFVKRFGGLVTIDSDGKTTPVAWAIEAPAFFAEVTRAFQSLLSNVRVNG